jgi:dTDP-4-dehydrorhamnose 3,5-epimerase
MQYEETPLKGCYIIHTTPFIDHRGAFARFFCERELAQVLGERKIANVNFSRTVKKGSIRGMHFQRFPDSEMKFVRCIRGKIFDVAVDFRTDSPTYLHWYGIELSADNMDMMAIPEGFAHGFQTLEDDAEIMYLVTAFYSPEHEDGLNNADPRIGICWPLPVADVSEKDRRYPYISDEPGAL